MIAAPHIIRTRAFVAALPLIAANNYWVIYCEKVKQGPYPTIISLFANAIFTLAVLALVNSLLRRISPRIAFTTAEMLVMYTMVAIGASLAGHDMIPSLLMAMTLASIS